MLIPIFCFLIIYKKLHRNAYGGPYAGQFNDSSVGQFADPGQNSTLIDYDQNYDQGQQNLQVFNPNMVDEPPILPSGRGRTTRITRSRGGFSGNIISHFHPLFFYFKLSKNNNRRSHFHWKTGSCRRHCSKSSFQSRGHTCTHPKPCPAPPRTSKKKPGDGKFLF